MNRLRNLKLLKNRKSINFLYITMLIILIIGIYILCNYLELKKLNDINNNNINIYFDPVNPIITTISADSSNRLILKAGVKDMYGNPLPKIPLEFISENNIGIFLQNTHRTNKFGEVLVSYIPPDTVDIRNINAVINDANINSTNGNGSSISNSNNSNSNMVIFDSGDSKNSVIKDVTLSAKIKSSDREKVSLSFKLIPVPVVLIHGYQSAGDVFRNMEMYLNEKDFEPLTLNYDSSKGIASSAEELKNFLMEQKSLYLYKGTQIGKFDLICHSMGGIVARYYSCSKVYNAYYNIRKIIFLSVPHKGSHLAPIGAKFFEDQGVKDLMPDSNLFTEAFPAMINMGLNPAIQIANLIGQYDEVVSPESGRLEEWGITTQVFNLGDSSLSLNNFSKESISESSIHRVILNNQIVFAKVVEMLRKNLTYPVLRIF